MTISRGEKFILKRAGIPPEMLETAMGEIHHSHEMLKKMVAANHETLHESCKDANYEKMHKDRPEMADYLLEGACVYRLISFLFFDKYGETEFNLTKELSKCQ